MTGIDFGGLSGNRKVDWDRLATKHRFAILRATFGLAQDGLFQTHWKSIKAAGMVRGAFCFPDLRLPEEYSVRQAETFIRVVGELGPGDFCPFIDLEGISKHHFPIDHVLAVTIEIARALKEHYGVLGIYSSRRVTVEELRNHKRLKELAALAPHLWLAKYTNTAPPVPDAWGGLLQPDNWTIHQYDGDEHGEPGIAPGAVVDLNRFHALTTRERGIRVLGLQHLLDSPQTGVFDEPTKAAVMAYQLAHGLTADGVVGPMTWSRVIWERRD